MCVCRVQWKRRSQRRCCLPALHQAIALRVLGEMSAYLHLMSLSKILASLTVTSRSAERVLRRVRVIKNRLWTSMADDWFFALTILAAESDVVRDISTDEIIDSFAQCSRRLREHLLG